MPKRPNVTVTSTGFMSAEVLNQNFSNIAAQFDNTVSRDGSVPNTMAGDLDMDGNDVLNVGRMDVASLQVNQIDLADIITTTGIAGDINNLELQEGDILYYDGTNVVRLAIGTEGQVLKVTSMAPAWGTDNNDDTVGVTVEEDDASVANNVTIINFVTGGANVVTDNGDGSVDVDLDAFIA